MENSAKLSGTHHTTLRPTKENYQRTVSFYTDVLGFTIQKEWKRQMNGVKMKCCMVDTDDGSLPD